MLPRRETYRGLSIFLPIVLWVDEGQVRPLDYDGDLVYRIDWQKVDLVGLADKIPEDAHRAATQMVRVRLSHEEEAPGLIEQAEIQQIPVSEPLDPTYLTRSIVDIVPNPWVARSFIGEVTLRLKEKGLSDGQIGRLGSLILDVLRPHLAAERDRLAEELFIEEVHAQRIQFRLRLDDRVWTMPETVTTTRPTNSQQLYREDGQAVQKSLFSPVYQDDLNTYERDVACAVDSEEAVRWWHRNVARHQYGIQGWRRHKVYPDFVFALDRDGGREEIVVLETKGDHLDNPDTAYKRKLLDLCTAAYRPDGTPRRGKLKLVGKDGKLVTCSLIFERSWKADLTRVFAGSIATDK